MLPDSDICPYCGQRIENISRDHIFPDFLGGTRTIPACATCNNRVFGSRFESKAAKELVAFQLMLSSLGLSNVTPKEGARWQQACEHNGELYDFQARAGKPVLVLTKPRISRDENGKIVSMMFRSIEEAKPYLRARPSRELIELNATIPLDDRSFRLSIGPDFGRLVLKMCAATATLMPSFNRDDIEPAIAVLRDDKPYVELARQDFRAFPTLDDAVPLLSHGMYVERGGGGVQGVVVIFGAFRMYCKLSDHPCAAEPLAILATLNVRTGEEIFSTIKPQGLTEAPFIIMSENSKSGIDSWAAKLTRQISEAGATGWVVSSNLNTRPRHELWQSSTAEIATLRWDSGTCMLPQWPQEPEKPQG